jgi:hypothetical protein
MWWSTVVHETRVLINLAHTEQVLAVHAYKAAAAVHNTAKLCATTHLTHAVHNTLPLCDATPVTLHAATLHIDQLHIQQLHSVTTLLALTLYSQASLKLINCTGDAPLPAAGVVVAVVAAAAAMRVKADSSSSSSTEMWSSGFRSHRSTKRRNSLKVSSPSLSESHTSK